MVTQAPPFDLIEFLRRQQQQRTTQGVVAPPPTPFEPSPGMEFGGPMPLQPPPSAVAQPSAGVLAQPQPSFAPFENDALRQMQQGFGLFNQQPQGRVSETPARDGMLAPPGGFPSLTPEPPQQLVQRLGAPPTQQPQQGGPPQGQLFPFPGGPGGFPMSPEAAAAEAARGQAGPFGGLTQQELDDFRRKARAGILSPEEESRILSAAQAQKRQAIQKARTAIEEAMAGLDPNDPNWELRFRALESAVNAQLTADVNFIDDMVGDLFGVQRGAGASVQERERERAEQQEQVAGLLTALKSIFKDVDFGLLEGIEGLNPELLLILVQLLLERRQASAPRVGRTVFRGAV